MIKEWNPCFDGGSHGYLVDTHQEKLWQTVLEFEVDHALQVIRSWIAPEQLVVPALHKSLEELLIGLPLAVAQETLVRFGKVDRATPKELFSLQRLADVIEREVLLFPFQEQRRSTINE